MLPENFNLRIGCYYGIDLFAKIATILFCCCLSENVMEGIPSLGISLDSHSFFPLNSAAFSSIVSCEIISFTSIVSSIVKGTIVLFYATVPLKNLTLFPVLILFFFFAGNVRVQTMQCHRLRYHRLHLLSGRSYPYWTFLQSDLHCLHKRRCLR